MINTIYSKDAEQFIPNLPQDKIEAIKNKTKTGLSLYTGEGKLCGVVVYSLVGSLFEEPGENIFLEDIVLFIH